MFLIPREPDRRRSKIYSNNKTVRSSKTSLLSTLTASTSGSSGSSSTVTQESYNRSHKHRRRRTKDHKSRRHHEGDRNRSVDVFDFLVPETVRSKESLPVVEEDDAQQGLSQLVEERLVTIVEPILDDPSDDENDDRVREYKHHNHEEDHVRGDGERFKGEVTGECHDTDNDSDNDDPIMIPSPGKSDYAHEPDLPRLHISTSHNEAVDSDPEGYYRSMSDSGISMGSSGSTQKPLPILHQEPDSRPSSRDRQKNELALIDPRWHWPALSPQPPHDGYIPPHCPQPPPAVMYEVPVYNPYPYPYPPTPYGTPPPPIPEPYIREPLAIREPKGLRTKPNCFRSFSRMNGRLLLRMEDDLADLEEELKQVEEEIDLTGDDSDHSTPSSRSMTGELKLREAEIYSEFHAKLDEYYHALEMKHKVDEVSQPAKLSDLPKHRQWLESRVLQPDRVRRLINNDLRKFSTKKQSAEAEQTEHITIQEPNFQPQYLAYTAFVNGVIPLIMFKLCTGVLNRLILLLTIIVAGSAVQDKMGVIVGKNELTCTLVCICISAFAGVFL